MKYPGRVVIKGEKDKAVVKAVQKQLNEQGCGPIDVDGDFGPKTFAAVKLFQSRFPDQNGNPLVVDGKLGPLSWSALFGESTVPINPEAQSVLLKRFWKLPRLRSASLKTKGLQLGQAGRRLSQECRSKFSCRMVCSFRLLVLSAGLR